MDSSLVLNQSRGSGQLFRLLFSLKTGGCCVKATPCQLSLIPPTRKPVSLLTAVMQRLFFFLTQVAQPRLWQFKQQLLRSTTYLRGLQQERHDALQKKIYPETFSFVCMMLLQLTTSINMKTDLRSCNGNHCWLVRTSWTRFLSSYNVDILFNSWFCLEFFFPSSKQLDDDILNWQQSNLFNIVGMRSSLTT